MHNHNHNNPPRLHLLHLTTSLDIILCLTLLSLSTLSYKASFRTLLWQNGGAKGWNSDPQQRVYDWANYKTLPPVPLVWDEKSSLSQLLLSAISLFTCVLRLHINYINPHALDFYARLITNAVYDVLLVVLWSCSATLQSTGDFSDPEHISRIPWYLGRGCGDEWGNKRVACEVVRGEYRIAVGTVLWFFARFLVTGGYAVYWMGREYEGGDEKGGGYDGYV